MKVETIETVTYTQHYIAADGTAFTTPEECKRYEESAGCVIKERFLRNVTYTSKLRSGDTTYGTPASYLCGLAGVYSDDNLFAYRVDTAEDIDNLAVYINHLWGESEWKSITYYSNTASWIGHTVIFEDYDGGIACLGTEEELRVNEQRAIDFIISGIPLCKDCKFCKKTDDNGLECTNCHTVDKGRDDKSTACWKFEEVEDEKF